MSFTKNIHVLDEFGTPLQGVNILIAPGVGTTTDQIGRATITSPSQNQVILFSHIGHTNEQFTFKDIPSVVMLISEVASLDEVIIIASKPEAQPIPKPPTPWYIWAGLGLTALGLMLTLANNSKEETQEVGLSEAKKPLSRKRTQKKKTKTSKKPIPVTI